MNTFIWDSKKPRIRNEVLQYIVMDWGLLIPNMIRYYHAARLSVVCSWWDQKDMDYDCSVEQVNILIPLTEWMLWGKDMRKGTEGLVLTTYKVLMEVWNKLQK